MAARTNSLEPTRTVVEQAAAWQAWLGDDERSAAGRVDLDRWLDEHPSHRVAFDRMSAIGGRLAGQHPIETAALRTMLAKPSRRAGLGAILLLGSVAASGWWGFDNPAIRARLADERSVIGAIRPVDMPTGDRITLDSDSAADLEGRSIRLWRGGLFARVQHGVGGSFVVHTPQGTARALGTQFIARIEGATTIIAVIASRVEACATAAPSTCLILDAGQAARLDSEGAHLMADIDPDTEAAWTEGLVIADDTPLAGVLTQLNRYRENPILFQPSDLAGLDVSGTFPINDAARALASIEAALPVNVETSADQIRVGRRRS